MPPLLPNVRLQARCSADRVIRVESRLHQSHARDAQAMRRLTLPLPQGLHAKRFSQRLLLQQRALAAGPGQGSGLLLQYPGTICDPT